MADPAWQAIPGWRDCYSVSTSGQVRNDRTGRVLRPTTHQKGYQVVTLHDRGRKRFARVHTLVLEAFVGPRPEGHEARHLNGRPGCNELANLQWGTPAENTNDKRRHGTVRRGEGHASARLTSDAVRRIRRAYAGAATLSDLAIEYGVNPTTIRRVVRFETWRHVA